MRRRTWLSLALLATLAGCGPPGKADVSGKVTHQGKPVIYGVVVLRGPDGIDMNGTIRTDGTYTVQGVTAGVVKVAVVSQDPAETAKMLESAGRKVGKGGKSIGAAAGPAPDPTKWFPLPAKYASPDTSELTTTLKSGANEYDVVLP